MEYGLQQNALNLVDDDPGVFQAAWALSTSIAHAMTGTERAFHWHFGEAQFSYDDDSSNAFDGNAAAATAATGNGGPCSRKAGISAPCSLYSGVSWVQAQAAHLFGENTALVLEATGPGSNSTDGGFTSADGIGGVNTSTGELGLLVTAFSPVYKTQDGPPVVVQVAFDAPSQWGELRQRQQQQQQQRQSTYVKGGLEWGREAHTAPLQLQMRTAVLNRTTSTFDAIWRDGKANGWLANPTDPNVYPLSKGSTNMLSVAGKRALIAQKGPAYLEMQRQTFAASDWYDAGGSVVCGGDVKGSCTVTLTLSPPAVMAVWVRLAPSL